MIGAGGGDDAATLARIALERLERGDVEAVRGCCGCSHVHRLGSWDLVQSTSSSSFRLRLDVQRRLDVTSTAGLRRLLHSRRLVRAFKRNGRLVRELGRVRAAYLETHPSA